MVFWNEWVVSEERAVNIWLSTLARAISVIPGQIDKRELQMGIVDCGDGKIPPTESFPRNVNDFMITI